MNENLKKQIFQKHGLDENKEKLNKNFDVFITCSGFEDRIFGLLGKLDDNIKIKKTEIFLYKPQQEDLYLKNIENLGNYKKQLEKLKIEDISVHDITPTNPWEFRKKMKQTIERNKINSESNVLIDITSFTRVFLYEIIFSLFSSKCKFLIAYSEPDDYVETFPSGINKIIISPSFPGRPRPSYKSIMLLFLGWETERTLGILDKYNPDDCIPIIGDCNIDQKHEKWKKISMEKNKKILRTMENYELISTLDIDEITKSIHKLVLKKTKEYENTNDKFYFSISGLGPKVQNLASCIYALTNKNIQLIYGTPAYWGPIEESQRKKPIESEGKGSVFLYGPFSNKIIKNSSLVDDVV